jgi:hypothetical protein
MTSVLTGSNALSNESLALEEIIITAQKRVESLQDVRMAGGTEPKLVWELLELVECKIMPQLT